MCGLVGLGLSLGYSPTVIALEYGVNRAVILGGGFTQRASYCHCSCQTSNPKPVLRHPFLELELFARMPRFSSIKW